MKYFVYTTVFLFFTLNVGFSQISDKNFYPKAINKVDLSIKTENEFKRRDELFAKGNLSKIETAELNTLLKKHSEVEENMWEVVEGGCSWYCGGGNYKVKSSSSLFSENDVQYGAKNANDLSYKTAWVEGKPDEGIGEFIEYYFKNDSPRITKIIISNGYMKSESTWKNNNRVKKLRLYINGKSFGILNLEDSKTDQVFELGTFGHNKNKTDLVFKFEIVEIYKGDKYNDTAITEIYFDGLDVHCFAKGTQILMSDKSTKNIELIQPNDSILTYDFTKGRLVNSKVSKLITAKHKGLKKLIFSDREVVVTTDHPFWTIDNKWASIYPEKSNENYNHDTFITQLKIGTKLFLPLYNVYAELKEIQDIENECITFTIELQDGNNFIANDFLVKTENPKLQ